MGPRSISLCMLSAACGSSINDTWRHIWTIVGLFGLTAAAGLSTVSRMTAAAGDAKRNQAMQHRCQDRRTRQTTDSVKGVAQRTRGCLPCTASLRNASTTSLTLSCRVCTLDASSRHRLSPAWAQQSHPSLGVFPVWQARIAIASAPMLA